MAAEKMDLVRRWVLCVARLSTELAIMVLDISTSPL